MGFFKKSVSSKSKRTALTIIAKGNKVSGDLTITGKLHVDGCIEGSIASIDDVSIGKSGQVIGKVVAKNITVSGFLEGDVECEHIHLAAGGKVVASVISNQLSMDVNSQFIGDRREAKNLQLNPVKEAEIAVNNATLVANIAPSSISITSRVDAGEEIADSETKAATVNSDIIDNLPDKVTLSSRDTENSDLDIESLSPEAFAKQNLSFLLGPSTPENFHLSTESTKSSHSSLESLDVEILAVNASDFLPNDVQQPPTIDESVAGNMALNEDRVPHISRVKENTNKAKVINEKTEVLELKF
jgi:cytoskeletal protein CcmA (bactofilin family)